MEFLKSNDWIHDYCKKQSELSEIIFEELADALVEVDTVEEEG